VKLLADSGFHSEKNLEMLKEKGIEGYVADNQYRKRDPRYETAARHKKPIDRYQGKKKGRRYYSPHDFVLNEKTGKLICPAGKELYVKNRTFRTRKGFQAIAYQAKKTDCRACGLREKCLQNPKTTEGRQVYKFVGWDRPKKITEWMKERIDSAMGRYIYSRRMGIAEPPFANIRDKLGLDRFTMRGRSKVSPQWKMFTMVHNMLKAYRFGWLAAGAG